MSLHKVITMAMHYVFLKSAKDKKIIITKAGDSKEKCTCLKLTQEPVDNNYNDRHLMIHMRGGDNIQARARLNGNGLK